MDAELPKSRTPLLLAVFAFAVAGLLFQHHLENLLTEGVHEYFELTRGITGETTHVSGAPVGQSAAIGLVGVAGLFKVFRLLLWMVVVVVTVRTAASVAFRQAGKTAGLLPSAEIARTVVSIAVYIVAFFMIFQSQFPDVELAPLFTGSTILGIVVGLALQDTLGNLFAGVATQADRPFQTGDVITLSSGKAGVVESVTWRAVKVRMFDHRLLVISNTELAKDTIEVSPRGRPNARYVDFSTEYSVSPAEVANAVDEALRNSENVASEPPFDVRLKEFKGSNVEWELKYFLEDYSRYEETDALVKKRIWYAFKRANIDFGYPVVRLGRLGGGPQGPDLTHEVAEGRLRQTTLFKPLSDTETASLAAEAVKRVYAPGEAIFRRGDEGRSMFVIHRGSVRGLIRENGAETVVADLSEGECFGEMGLFTGEARPVDAVAVVETEIIEVEWESLKSLLDSNTELVASFGELIARRKEMLDSSRTEAAAAPAPGKTDIVDAMRKFFRLG